MTPKPRNPKGLSSAQDVSAQEESRNLSVPLPATTHETIHEHAKSLGLKAATWARIRLLKVLESEKAAA